MKKYQIIYADPAWDMGYVKGGLTAGSVKGGEVLPYQTMKDEAIMAMPICDIVHENALLFMWVTDNRIPKISQFMEAWGFKFNSLAFVWNKISKHQEGKVRTTLTPYTRRSCEYCFLGTRGKTRDLIKDHYVLQYVAWASQTRKHSVKPPEVRDRIVALCGDIPRVELFAREQIEGWDVFGNEVENSINLKNYANIHF
jgi:site-specific DNA-methyltransferase (adenine-specific)